MQVKYRLNKRPPKIFIYKIQLLLHVFNIVNLFQLIQVLGV